MKMSKTDKKIISIVIPVLNEEQNVRYCYDELARIINSLDYTFEIIFTDNHSVDGTFELIKEIAAKDPRVKIAKFAANVGYQRSILSGLLIARGDAMIQLDCDLQDPPHLIPKMIELWKEDNQVVYGVRRKRKEGLVITYCRKLFYRLINWLSPADIPKDAGDFRLIDRCVVEAIAAKPIKSPYIRGEIARVGFNQVGFEYERDQRLHGETKFTLGRLVRLTADAIVSQSVIPLRIASFIGFVTTAISVILVIGYAIASITIGSWPRGFTTLAILSLLNLGLVSLLLGILGEYVIRVIEQVSHGPISIIQQTVNLEEEDIERRVQIQYAVPSNQKKANPNEQRSDFRSGQG